MKLAPLTAALLLAVAGTAFATAGGIEGIKVEPSPAKVGQPVKITVSGDASESTYCGLLTVFGDGKDQRSTVGKEAPFPKTATYTYAKPGTYTVKAEGRKVDGRFGCPGTAETSLVVEAAPAAPAPAKGATATGAACPEGYALKGKAGKKGDFTCTAGKGAKKPEKVMDCADGLEYFQTKTTLGCRKAK